MINKIKIRQAKLDDVEAISTIKVKGWQNAYKDIIDNEYLDNMNIERVIRKNRENFSKQNFIVAEMNQIVVGFCGYGYNYENNTEADCELIGIYVKPELKRNGIGRELIKYVIDECKNAGRRKLILWCLKRNYLAREFYEAMGGIASSIRWKLIGENQYEMISYLYELKDELELVFPTIKYKNQVEEYLQEFLDNGEKKIAGDGGLSQIKDFNQWLQKIENNLSEEKEIPSTVYLTVRKSDNKVIGNLQIRHKLNQKLLLHGGHIGGSIRPSERRKGYGTQQIKLALNKCKELRIDNVLMTCNKNNVGSGKSIQSNGGVLENEIKVDNELVQRYWISLKKRYSDRYALKKSYDTIYKIKTINSSNFTGDVCYYYFKKVVDKITIPDGSCIMNDNYEWLEFYDYNSKIKLTAIYDDQNQIIEWYFDIARKIGKENSTPYEDDLYLDVLLIPNGEITLLDEDELQLAYDRLEISKEIYDMAYNEANQLINKLRNNTYKVKGFTDEYLKQFQNDEKMRN